MRALVHLRLREEDQKKSWGLKKVQRMLREEAVPTVLASSGTGVAM